MKYIRRRYEIAGLGIERLLDSLQKAGITLFDVRRVRPHAVRFSVGADQSAQAEAYASEHGFSCKEMPEAGLTRKLQQIKRRWIIFPLRGVAAAALRPDVGV